MIDQTEAAGSADELGAPSLGVRLMQRRETLEDAVLNLIGEFESETGCYVDTIEVSHGKYEGNDVREWVGVSIGARLP